MDKSEEDGQRETVEALELELADEIVEWDRNIDMPVDERAVKILATTSKKYYDDVVE